jgi:hypothetical protein
MDEPSAENPVVRFTCPLCGDVLNREVPIAVEFDVDAYSLSVANLSGCAHAVAFGVAGALTEEQKGRIVDAALKAFDAWRRARGWGGRDRRRRRR